MRVVNFAFFDPAHFRAVFPSPTLADADGNAIEVRGDARAPAARLRGADAGLRLVYVFAGDPNAYPGNEYWLGQLDASGDPAAAACSTIDVLGNVDVNPDGLAGGNAVVWSSSGEHAKL